MCAVNNVLGSSVLHTSQKTTKGTGLNHLNTRSLTLSLKPTCVWQNEETKEVIDVDDDDSVDMMALKLELYLSTNFDNKLDINNIGFL